MVLESISAVGRSLSSNRGRLTSSYPFCALKLARASLVLSLRRSYSRKKIKIRKKCVKGRVVVKFESFGHGF
jgi:hypothetical protein